MCLALCPLVELKCDIVSSPVSPGLTGHNGHKRTSQSRYRHRPWSTLYKIRVGIIMSNSYIVHPRQLVGKYFYCPEKMPGDTRQLDTRFVVIKRKILISNSLVSLVDVLCGEQGHFLLDTPPPPTPASILAIVATCATAQFSRETRGWIAGTRDLTPRASSFSTESHSLPSLSLLCQLNISVYLSSLLSPLSFSPALQSSS